MASSGMSYSIGGSCHTNIRTGTYLWGRSIGRAEDADAIRNALEQAGVADIDALLRY